MKTKILRLLLITTMSLGTLNLMSASAEVHENLTYEVSDGKVTVTGYTEEISGELVVPDTIDGYTVAAIERNAFEMCSELTSVKIPDSVEDIGICAFYNCENLTKIEISDSVVNIDDSAFWLCKNLTDILVDENNAYYSVDEFGVLFNKDKTKLIQYPLASENTAYKIPDSVTELNPYAFDGNVTLTDIAVGDGITKLDRDFIKIENVAYVELGKNVAEIDYIAFDNNLKLEKISVDEENAYYSADESGVLFNKDKTQLIKYPAMNPQTSYVIPDSVTGLGNRAFYKNATLTEITIPDSVKSLRNNAFVGCTGLTCIKVGEGVSSIEADVFSGCTAVETVIIPKSVTVIEADAFAGCDNIKTVEYEGLADEWAKVFIGHNNGGLNTANILYRVNLTINGETVEFDRTPIIENGRTLVPFRAIFETFGADVLWDDETKTVTAEKDGLVIELQIDSTEMMVGDEVKALDVPAKIVSNRTLVPVRAIAEALGCKVDWDDATKTVIIES